MILILIPTFFQVVLSDGNGEKLVEHLIQVVFLPLPAPSDMSSLPVPSDILVYITFNPF